jgi:4'-phosphopantetheinyl transferase
VTPAGAVVVVAPLPRRSAVGAERVVLQREHAREAARLGAQLRCGGELVFEKDANDVPRPCNGWHWSVSHSRASVAAAVDDAPIGVDVEDARAVSDAARERILSPAECALFDPRSAVDVLRAWTAKEAVLKELGIGLAGLAACSIRRVEPTGLEVAFGELVRWVHQRIERERVVSVSSASSARATFRVLDAPVELGARV